MLLCSRFQISPPLWQAELGGHPGIRGIPQQLFLSWGPGDRAAGTGGWAQCPTSTSKVLPPEESPPPPIAPYALKYFPCANHSEKVYSPMFLLITLFSS